ncbi:MAG TPA: hypothetical protein VF750_05195 [Sphingomicrobium sp.]
MNMMRGMTIAAGAVALLGTAAVSAPKPKGAAKPTGVTAIAKTLDCAAHRFEATIHLSGPGGKLQDKTVRMCGTKGSSDAEWISTLKDAVAKTAASEMPQAAKEQIVAAVNAEIQRLSLPRLDLPQGGDISTLPRTAARSAPAAPLTRDYNALPPLPTASTVPPPQVLGPEAATAPTAHLTLRCALAGDEDRPGSCETIDKDTVLVVRADEAYPKGLAMRFMRHGDSRAEIALPAMAAGATTRIRIPRAVCTGVVRSKVEIRALGANAAAGTLAGTVGEYDLRC